MNYRYGLISTAVCVCLIGTACKSEKSSPAKVPEKQSTAKVYAWGLPDPGGVEQVNVRATGSGRTSAAAVSDALRKAVIQVSGVEVVGTTSQGPTSELGLRYEDTGLLGGKKTLDIRSSSFHDDLVTSYSGRVSGFRIVAERASAEGVLIDVEAQVPQFKAPASNRIAVVVAEPRVGQASFSVDGRQVGATHIAESVRASVLQSLSATGRVDVLERTYDAEVQEELSRLAQGASNRDSSAKLGQQLAADFVWVATIQQFGATRHTQELRIGGGRRLESIDGGAEMSHRLVNVVTGQVLFADTVSAEGPRVEATTLGASISVDDAVKSMTRQLSDRASQQVVGHLFPVVVLSRSGDTVVLSQGKGAVQVGKTYRLRVLGESLVDPQTGQSLGFAESDGGVISVTRVAEKVGYGTVSATGSWPRKVQAGQIQLGEEAPISGRAGGRAIEGGREKSPARRGSMAPELADTDVDFDFGAKGTKAAPTKPKG